MLRMQRVRLWKLRKNFYVNDMCKSCATAEEAISLVSELCTLLDSGGFHLTKFVSNDKNVLRSFPTGELAATVKMTDHELPTQKALGVYWNAETDRLEVRVSICRIKSIKSNQTSAQSRTAVHDWADV